MSALLLDALKKEFDLPTDAALGRHIDEPRQLISTIRLGKASVPDRVIIKVHKATKWPVSAIEALIGAKESA